MMGMKRQIVVNIFSNYAGRGVSMLLGFLLVPFLIHKLGVAMFGIIVLFEGLMTLLEIACVSVRVALSRHTTFALAQGKTDEFVDYLSTGRVILFVLSIIILVGGLVFSYFTPFLFRIPEGHWEESRILFSTMTVAFAITIPNMVFWTGLYARQRFDLINLSTSAGIILRALSIFLMFSFLPQEWVTLSTYGIIYLIMTWGQNTFVYFSFKRILPDIVIRMSRFKKEKMREIIAFGSLTLISHASWAFSENMMNVMINWLWGPSANAIYAIGMKFPQIIRRFFEEPIWSLTPTYTDLVAKGDLPALKQLHFLFTKIMATVTVPIILFLMVFAAPIINLWVGAEFAESVPIMVLTLLPQLVAVSVSSNGNFPNAFGKIKLPSILHSILVPVYFGLALFFSRGLAFGLPGVSMAGALLNILYIAFFLASYACRLAGFSVREFWLQAYLRAAGWAFLVWGLCFWWTNRFDPEDGLFSPVRLVWFAAALVIYAAGAYLLVLDLKERRYVKTFLDNVKKRLGRTGS